MNNLETEAMPDLKRLITQTPGKTVIRFPDRAHSGASLFLGIIGLSCLILAMWYDKLNYASEFAFTGWALRFMGLMLAVGLLWSWMWFVQRWVRVTITPERLKAERFCSVSTLLDVAITQVHPPAMSEQQEANTGRHVSFSMTPAGAPTAPEQGIVISHAWGFVVVGAGLSSESRETLRQFLAEQIAFYRKPVPAAYAQYDAFASPGRTGRTRRARGADAAQRASFAAAPTNATEPTLTFAYGNPWHYFLSFLVFLAFFAFMSYSAATNDRGLILNGAHFEQRGATIIYWIMAAVLFMGNALFFGQWHDVWKHPRQLILKPDGLEIYDKGTKTSRAVQFKEMTNLTMTIMEKNGVQRENELVLHLSTDVVGIEREKLTHAADFETIRDWITNGYERYK